MRTYLDNNATTEIHPEVLEAFEHELRRTWGNASSIHEEGQRARRRLEEAREAVAALIGAPARQVIFTSGGTESNNLALFGVVPPGAKRCHIVTSAIEHPSVLEVTRQLEKRGHEVTRVAPRNDGAVDPNAVIAAMRPETKLVALMLANNETGVVQPVEPVAAICRERGIHIHCDAVQAAGRIRVDVENLNVDSLSLSGHKMHAPKGIGALYVREGATLDAHMVGGAQERRRRAGTENVPMAVVFGLAASLVDFEAMRHTGERRDTFEQMALRAWPGAMVNGAGAERVPNTSNLCLPGVDAEGLVIGLDLAGIAVSTGSACSSGRVEPSHLLLAMGLSLEDARSSIRISLSRFTTDGEISKAAALLAEVAPLHRRKNASAKS